MFVNALNDTIVIYSLEALVVLRNYCGTMSSLLLGTHKNSKTIPFTKYESIFAFCSILLTSLSQISGIPQRKPSWFSKVKCAIRFSVTCVWISSL